MGNVSNEKNTSDYHTSFTYIQFSGQVGCPSCEEETVPFARYKRQKFLVLVTAAKANNILTDSRHR
jgi:hypothetical protein